DWRGSQTRAVTPRRAADGFYKLPGTITGPWCCRRRSHRGGRGAHGGEELVLGGIDLHRQVLVLDLGGAGVDLQADDGLLAAGQAGVLVDRELVAVDAHADDAGLH